MRARAIAVPTAFAGAVALALAPALSAAAADHTWVGTGGVGQWWADPAAFSAPLVAGGSAVFSDASPTIQTESSIMGFGGALSLDEVRFDVSHRVIGSDTALETTGGVSVAADATVLLSSDVHAATTQTWTVASGGALTLPGLITVDGGNTLTLQVDGILAIQGNIDGLGGTGRVVQTGEGIVTRSGGLGGDILDGYTVASGEFFLDGATIAGTDVASTGGAISGDGVVGALSIADGALAPGDPAGDPYGTLIAQRDLTLTSGISIVDIDPVAVDNDYVMTSGVLTGTGMVLLPITTSTPAVGDAFDVVGADLTGTVDPGFRFTSPAGAVLEDGDEFVLGTQRWSIDYVTGTGGVVIIEYLGEVPPVVPVTPALPATGQAIDWMLPVGIGAGVLVLAGVVVVIVRAVRARRSDEV